MVALHSTVADVTNRIIKRSTTTRQAYLQRVDAALHAGKVERSQLACTNLAHALAAMPPNVKGFLKAEQRPNLAIISSYNDLLSAHQPFVDFPAQIKEAALVAGAVAQFAGGVPAMCDGITQGQTGMELSLFSRDVIAMSTAIALSHQLFDAALYLGICDKIVPGLLIGALSFGHLPAVFVPAGPMTSGKSNDEKTKIRQQFAAGEIGRDVLLNSECAAYHEPGTCTFYGTANSNQMLMEIMGLHLPGSAFVHPNTPLREALTKAAATQAAHISTLGKHITPVGKMIDERSIVNAIVGLLSTGGSTNHTLHLVAIARIAGIQINWDDLAALSAVVPLLARIYPNGKADINQFHAAGGMGFLIRELLQAGLLHEAVNTIMGIGLSAYTQEPWLNDGKLAWREAPAQSLDETLLCPVNRPFSPNGGLTVLSGNIGRAVIKVSAVAPEHWIIEAPAKIFHDQDALLAAYKRGELEQDMIAVLRFQGPRANGMPELHKLTPALTNLQEKGFKVALVTDGRMSGASGKVPAAIHVTPEALCSGTIGKIQDGDIIRLDIQRAELQCLVDETTLQQRPQTVADLSAQQYGVGRELFSGFRMLADDAEMGASSFYHPDWNHTR